MTDGRPSLRQVRRSREGDLAADAARVGGDVEAGLVHPVQAEGGAAAPAHLGMPLHPGNDPVPVKEAAQAAADEAERARLADQEAVDLARTEAAIAAQLADLRRRGR